MKNSEVGIPPALPSLLVSTSRRDVDVGRARAESKEPLRPASRGVRRDRRPGVEKDRTRTRRIALFTLSLAALVTDCASAGEHWGPWRVLLPIDFPAGSAGIAEPAGPEDELDRLRTDGPGPDFERVFAGKGVAQVRWQELPDRVYPPGAVDATAIDLEAVRRKLAPTGYSSLAVAYLHRTIETGREAKIPVACGSDDAIRVWLDGELVHEVARPRALNPYEDFFRLYLSPGTHHLLVKVVNEGGAWGVQLSPEITPDGDLMLERQRAVNDAIDRGVRWLLDQQERDGSWSFHMKPYRNGQTALSLYTLLKCGVDPDHPAIRRGLEFLRWRRPQHTYSLACELMALTALPGEEQREWIEEDLELLLDWQRGAFAYPTGAVDLSNTQYAALGLWAAARKGLAVPARAWRDLVSAGIQFRARDGGFGYHKGEESRGSMTAAGIFVLAIGLERLGARGQLGAQNRREAEGAIHEALELLENTFALGYNPVPARPGERNDRWSLYYLYGIERVAAALDLKRLGDLDWYWAGALHLLGRQHADGHWASVYGESQPNTCFALLFLERATAKMTGEGLGTRHESYAIRDPQAQVRLFATGDTPLTVWIEGFGESVYERLGVAEGQGLPVARVEYLEGERVLATVQADPARSDRTERYAAQLRFERNGTYQIRARVTLDPGTAAGGDASGPVTLTSPLLAVRIDEVLEDWMLDAARSGQGELMRETKVEVTASSTRPDSNAFWAVDGVEGTAWWAKSDDDTPTLTLRLKRPVRANLLRVGVAGQRSDQEGEYARPTRIAIVLNRTERTLIEVALLADVRRPVDVDLGRARRVKELEIRILEQELGSKFLHQVGFSELGLYLRSHSRSR